MNSLGDNMKTIIAVNGACGRMGQRIIQLAHEDPALTIGAALAVPVPNDLDEIIKAIELYS